MSDGLATLRKLVTLHAECQAVKAKTFSKATGWPTRDEYTADHRFNALAREAMPALVAALATLSEPSQSIPEMLRHLASQVRPLTGVEFQYLADRVEDEDAIYSQPPAKLI